MKHASRAWLVLFALLWLAGSLRAFALWSHEPLYAYANSYDQTRYTNCFGFHPDRPPEVPPQQNSPQAPYAKFRFIESGDPMCYWSSELVFTGAVALAWRTGEALGSAGPHDVRLVGALRWGALLALSIAFSVAWWRRGEPRPALAHALLVPLLFADPANTLFLDTFYAEWTALLAAYALVAATLLWRDAPYARRRFALLALAAFALATAKIQHLLLPGAIALAVLALDRARHGRTGWRATALAFGALAGFWLQFVQLQRDDAMMDAIDQYNRADVLFTALLPASSDPQALLVELGVDRQCARYSGLHAWELPAMPEQACAGFAGFSRGDQLLVLARHPRIALSLAWRGVRALDPWLAREIGHVEGGTFEHAPVMRSSLDRALHAAPTLHLAVLAAPLAAVLVLLWRVTIRRGSRALEYAALCAIVMLATLAVTVLGDGLADVAKQGHLVTNAALAWLLATLAVAGRRARGSGAEKRTA